MKILISTADGRSKTKKALELFTNKETKDGNIANDQAARTDPIKRGLVTISWYLYRYFIAT